MNSLLRIIPRLQVFGLAVVALLWLVQTVLRLIFWLRFHDPADPVAGNDLLWSFYLGLKFDLRIAIFAVIPILLLGWIKPLHPVYSRFGRKLWLAYSTLALLMLLLFYATDFGHYAYLQQRLNATALRFLENLQISATMVWESYPVITGGLILLALSAAGFIVLRRLSARITPLPQQYNRWYQKTGVVLITFFLTLFLAYGKLSWYPLRWSDAFFSTQAFAGQLATNPVMYFFETMKNRVETYDLAEVKKNYPLMAKYLGVKKPDIEKLDFRRDYHFNRDLAAPRNNLVFVFLESFASYKSTLSGNPLKTTPHLQQLADEGYFFKNFFVTQTGTARSVWTFTTGIPDVEKNRTSSRNPLIVDQHTIIDAFRDYKKFYFLGGSASWANIRGLLAANIPGLEIHEEGSYESPRVDVWGISDLSLFEEANKVLKDLKDPFVAVIQTSGNHRPYTIPEDHRDFKILSQDDLPHTVTDYGFASIEELNSFRFMDYSIGNFIKVAKQEDYFKHTLFVFFGDHGIHAETGKHTPKSEAQLGISGLRVPLVMYGPGVIKQPRVFDRVASQVDILPTVAALTKTDYVNTTLGRDLLDEQFDDDRYAFTIEHHGTRTIGLLSSDFYLQMGYNGGHVMLHDLHSETPRDDVSAQHPELAASQAQLLQTMRSSIQYMREHNPNLDSTATETGN
jgi:phosphoglycerol transferase MdoB-like AlkP superfamily enzyme